MGATRTGNGAVTALTAAGFPPDLYWAKSTAGVRDHAIFDRLRGPLPLLSSNNTQNEIAYTDDLKSFNMTGVTTGTDGSTNAYNQNGVAYVNWYMRRAPSFFDEVCYTGDGTTSRNVTHNLTVQPELVVVKSRSNGSTNWVTGVYANATQSNLWLNSTAADGSASSGGITYTQFSTSASFRLSAVGGIVTDINTTSATYVAYLFATCAGVSKVGSYTGNGTTQTINCGFGAGGARFVLIKRTDSTGNWYVYDTARGMTVLTDPYLFLNSDTAETATLGSVTTVSTGFALNSAILAAINVSAGTYIFLAIA